MGQFKYRRKAPAKLTPQENNNIYMNNMNMNMNMDMNMNMKTKMNVNVNMNMDMDMDMDMDMMDMYGHAMYGHGHGHGYCIYSRAGARVARGGRGQRRRGPLSRAGDCTAHPRLIE